MYTYINDISHITWAPPADPGAAAAAAPPQRVPRF